MEPPFTVRLLQALAWLGGLPGRRLRGVLANGLAVLARWRGAKGARIVAVNLRLTGLADRVGADAVLRHTVLTMLESLRFWTREPRHNLAEVAEVLGGERLEAALAGGRGVLVVAPHYGNWELLVQWLAAQGPSSLLYTRGEGAAMDGFLRRARGRGGVRTVAADAHGMKPLLKALQRGELVGITPDQVPAGGGGWAPFFGVPALTMSLLPRLAARSGARLLLAAAERRDDGRFRILILPGPEDDPEAPLETRLAALNAAVEALVRRDPAQYQWTYKRFRGEHPVQGPINPYWPECY
jgi:KDO2-lipid IV(A) lauroyltransferase